jgi:protein O-mannosyl-transferase
MCGALLLAALVVLIYMPSHRGGFLLDDDLLVSGNPLIKAPDGLQKIWFTTQAPDYWPVTNTSLWIDWRLWGANPAGYHATNVALHILGSLLVWLVLRRLSIPGTFLAAMLFAVHPVNVESVAWIAQRKNVLALCFFLVSVYSFLRFQDQPSADRRQQTVRPKNRWYWFSLAAFVLAMLSKGSVAVLPLVLLLLQWWRNREITKHDWTRLAPFFAVAVGLTIVNLCWQSRAASGAIRSVGSLERLLGAGEVVWFYLAKALAPLGLVFIYPQWTIRAADWQWWAPLIAAAACTGILIWQRRTRFGRPLLLAWGFFCISLFPVMGFTDVGFMRYSLVADHYQHLALLAVVAVVAAVLAWWSEHVSAGLRILPPAFAVTIVCGLAILTLRQSQLYASPIVLYRNTIENNLDCWMAYNNLGNALRQVGQTDAAIAQYEMAIAVRSDYAEAFSNRAAALVELGRWDDAVESARQAVDLKPSDPVAHNNLAMALAHSGKDEAVRQYQQALQIDPNYAEAESNLGVLLAQMGQPTAAIEHLERAIGHKPDYAPAYSNLGNTLAQAGNLERACLEFKLAVQFDPQSAEVHNNFGAVLQRVGKLAEAIDQYQQALRLKPDYAEAHSNLGGALAQTGRDGEAIVHYRAAVKLNPDFAEAHYNLGLALSKLGKSDEATEQFRETVRLQPGDLQSYLNLANTCAQSKRTEEATTAAKAALALARAGGQFDLAKKIELWITTLH